MDRRLVAGLINHQLPVMEAAHVVNLRNGDGNGGGDNIRGGQLDELQMQPMRRQGPQIAVWLDAPHEPPVELHHLLAPENVPQRPRKKRSFLTISKTPHVQPERCALISDGWKAVQCVPPEERRDHFAQYLMKHMNSRNYPNGEGLPHRWGQF